MTHSCRPLWVTHAKQPQLQDDRENDFAECVSPELALNVDSECPLFDRCWGRSGTWDELMSRCPWLGYDSRATFRLKFLTTNLLYELQIGSIDATAAALRCCCRARPGPSGQFRCAGACALLPLIADPSGKE